MAPDQLLFMRPVRGLRRLPHADRWPVSLRRRDASGRRRDRRERAQRRSRGAAGREATTLTRSAAVRSPVIREGERGPASRGTNARARRSCFGTSSFVKSQSRLSSSWSSSTSRKTSVGPMPASSSSASVSSGSGSERGSASRSRSLGGAGLGAGVARSSRQVGGDRSGSGWSPSEASTAATNARAPGGRRHGAVADLVGVQIDEVTGPRRVEVPAVRSPEVPPGLGAAQTSRPLRR